MDPGKRTFYLGRYNCIEQLGTGPLGETYRAKIYGVAGFEKQFAVKRLHPQLSEDEAFVARFVQAASAFATLEHQGIARVHEVNAQGAHYYIVVDLVRGLDLRRLLDLLQQRGEALAADAAMTITVDVANALEHAHSRTNVLPGGVLHLGLTAPSVMLTYEGEVKLVDVGLVAALVRPGWSDDDALVPTLAYLAPEVWRGEGFDVRADVFSLGVVLHELLGGGRAFLSDRAGELRKAIEGGPPPPPSADPRLQQIVTRALEPDPARRFATVEEMRVAIQAILGGRAERARADLSATVRRLAAPRERRTGAFASVTLMPAASGMTSPVTGAKPPPIPPARPHTWAPPVPRPPAGGSLSPIPVHNTLAGIGPDDQALVPIELVELPGLPTEKAMPTVEDDAQTNRVQRVGSDGLRAATPPPPPAPALHASAAPSDIGGATKSGNDGANGKIASRTADEATPVPEAATAGEGAATSEAAAATQPTNGANGETAREQSWTPPALTPAPPSPEPLFAEPADERPVPVEPARSSVPGATLPPTRRGGTIAVVGGVVLLAAGGALAIYAGLRQPAAMTSARTAPNEPTTTTAAGEQPTAVAAPAAPSARPAPLPAPTAAAPAPTAAPTPTAAAPTPTASAPTPTAAAPTPTAGAPTPSAAATPTPHPPTNPATQAPAATQPPTAPPSGPTFVIASTPDGATVFVDGEERGTTPAQIAAAPGKHSLVVLGEGQKMVKRSVELVAGGRLDLQLEPARLTSAIAGSDGLKVRCHTHGELRIFVDGEDSGRTCPNDERISVAAGPHKIGLYSARTGEMHELEHEVDVAEGNNSTRVYVKY